MKIDFDSNADALTLVLAKGKVVQDKAISHNVFAGFDKKGQLVELQILDISEHEKVWISVEAASKLLNKSERTILRWIHSGKIPSQKVGREYRIPIEEIQALAG